MTIAEWEKIFSEIKAIRAGCTRTVKNEHKNISFRSSGGFSRNNISMPKNKFSKQVVVKMISNLPTARIKNCIDYALKNSLDSFAVNEKGERVHTGDIIKEWSKDFGTSEKSRDAWHLIFSISEPCNYDRTLKKLEASVCDVLGNNFDGHKYAFVIHTHQNNPHVHVVLNKRNIFTGKKIHFDNRDEIRDFFDNVRTNFAYALGARGLKYENKNFLQKDLKSEFNKIKSSVKLERDDYTAKDKINDYYDKMQSKNQQNYKVTASRINAMNDELNVLKKTNFELERLFWELRKKKIKRWYKVAKDLKESNKILKSKRIIVLNECKKLDRIVYQATQLNEMKFANYKDRSSGLVLLENFAYNYKKLIPNNSKIKPSKADFENYQKVRRAIAMHGSRESDDAKKYFDDSLIITRMLGRNESIFKLDKKLEILDKSLYMLEHSDIKGDEANSFKKRLLDNREFITDICKNRLEYAKNRLLKADKIDNNSFLFKEYFKGIFVLDVKPDERLLKIKDEKILHIETGRGANKDKFHRLKSKKSNNENSNEWGGR